MECYDYRYSMETHSASFRYAMETQWASNRETRDSIVQLEIHNRTLIYVLHGNS